MYRWTGSGGSASLSDEVEEELRRRITNILGRHGLGNRLEIVQELFEQVSWALAARQHKLSRTGRGRPVDGPEKLLAVLVPEVLERHSVRGNWLQGDNGEIGIVAELEAVAQAALRQARKQDRETMARPARASEARRMLGKIYRNDPLPKSDQNN
jgi:hypothetical protein